MFYMMMQWDWGASLCGVPVRSQWQLTSWRWKLSQVCLASGGRVLGNNLHTSLLSSHNSHIPHCLMVQIKGSHSLISGWTDRSSARCGEQQGSRETTQVWRKYSPKFCLNNICPLSCMAGGICVNIKISKYYTT